MEAGLEVECRADVYGPAARHPRIASATTREMEEALRWRQGGQQRAVYVGHPEIALHGVVELADNNPLVCANSFSLPSPAATLALLAVGPLAEAGILVEPPAMMVSVETDESEIAPFLEKVGWSDGILVAAEERDFGGAAAATVFCELKTPERLEDLDDLYEERYARSFFVRRDETSEWDAKLVIGRAHAVYRLYVTPDSPNSLLRIQIMADRDGKCGAAQVIHAMNVMCGFEESLGLESGLVR